MSIDGNRIVPLQVDKVYEMTHEEIEEIREFLCTMTLQELSFLYGTYCGPSNVILSEKKFGYTMPARLVQEVIGIKALEEALDVEIATNRSTETDS